MKSVMKPAVLAAVLLVTATASAQSKPDLMILSVQPVPETSCKPGAPVWSFKVTVMNRGTGNAPGVPLGDFIKVADVHGGWESTAVEIAGVSGSNAPFIPAGASRVVTASLHFNEANTDHMWEMPTHPVRITVDHAGKIDEANENNNQAQGVVPPLPACRADLTIAAARFVQSSDEYYGLVTIRNDGMRPVTRASVGLVNEKSAGPDWRETWTGTLKHGQTAEVRVTGSLHDDAEREPGEKPRPPHRWTDFSCITAVVDPSKQISETNENNNQMKCISVKKGT